MLAKRAIGNTVENAKVEANTAPDALDGKLVTLIDVLTLYSYNPPPSRYIATPSSTRSLPVIALTISSRRRTCGNNVWDYIE